MTVRNNKQKIVQYSYGDDGVDTVRVENQLLPLVDMTIEDIYAHFHMPSDDLKDAIFTTSYTKAAITRMKKQKKDLNAKCLKYIDYMTEMRNTIVKNIFQNKNGKMVHLPVSMTHIINNVQGIQNINKNSIVYITPY